MRILHVVPTYYPAIRYGGPIPAVHDMARAMAERGHDVHVFTTNIDGPGVSDVPLGIPVERDGVQVHYSPVGFGRRLYRSPDMRRALQRSLPAFSVAHLHSVFLWPTMAAARVARKARVPYLITPHGMLNESLIRARSGLAKRTWITLFESRNVAGAAAVHVTSAVEAGELSKLGLGERRVAIVPCILNLSGVSAEKSGVPAAGSGNPRPFVLFLGRINWEKGLDRLIRAMVQAESAHLVIAGNDEGNYRPEIESLAREAGIAERVQFIGPVHGAAKWALLREAALLVLPSYSENFGIVVLEAMAAGCPVVVTPEVGMAGAVRETGSGLVVDGDPATFGSAMARLLADPELARRMGEAGRRAACERFSWNAIGDQMETLYRECLEEAGRT